MSIPQPPNPPASLPEKYGQFGPINFTYVSPGNNFFVISNPGRSA